MVLKDRFGKVIKPHLFDPPMHFVVDRSNVALKFNNNLLPLTSTLSYRHHRNMFTVEMVKILTENDVSKGFLVCGVVSLILFYTVFFPNLITNRGVDFKMKVLHYGHFVEQALDRARINLRIVDECGNFWECVLVFDSVAFAHCMIGGGWRRFVGARNLKEGDRMRIGIPAA